MNFPFRNPINKLQNSDNSNIHPQPNLFTNHLHSALTINSHKSHELLNFKNEYHLSDGSQNLSGNEYMYLNPLFQTYENNERSMLNNNLMMDLKKNHTKLDLNY